MRGATLLPRETKPSSVGVHGSQTTTAITRSEGSPTTRAADRVSDRCICIAMPLHAPNRGRSKAARLLLSPRSERVRPGLGATAFVLAPVRAGLSQWRRSSAFVPVLDAHGLR